MGERRFVIVTGGSSGIGLATALAFSSRGDHVALMARDAGRLAEAARRCEQARVSPEQRVEWCSVDLSDPAATETAFRVLAESGFLPDVLVNSAGVIVPGEFATMSAEEFSANHTCGFWSVVNPCKAAVPGMIERRRGHILNVSSVAGYLGIYGYSGYSSAKFATMGFSEALRFELKPHGVRVSVVCPPDTDTPALEAEKRLRPRATDVIAGNIKPVGPEKVAAAIVRAVDRGTYLVIPDALSAFYFRLKGLLPEVFFLIVDGDVRKALGDRGPS